MGETSPMASGGMGPFPPKTSVAAEKTAASLPGFLCLMVANRAS
jgi:hypothetical protein